MNTYEKKHKEEIIRATQLWECGDITRENLEYIFPELAESEDEKIRKWIIDDIRYNMNNEPLNNSEYKKEAEKAIAWLEKQKEFVSADFDDVWDTADCDELTAPLEKYSKDAIKEMCHAWYDKGIELERKSWLEKQGKEEYALNSSKHEDVYKFMQYIEKEAKAYEFNLPNRGYDIYAFAKDILVWLEKQGEQKHADKVQPKFHRGEWIVYHGTENIYHVIAIVGNQYQLKYGDNYTIKKCADVDRCARLWDITKDAKDGDVLVHNDCTFIFKGIKDGIVQAIEENILEPVSFGKPDEDNDYHLATKEQRDLFFKKINEAGYMWDSDSKRLYKL